MSFNFIGFRSPSLITRQSFIFRISRALVDLAVTVPSGKTVSETTSKSTSFSYLASVAFGLTKTPPLLFLLRQKTIGTDPPILAIC